MAVRFDHGTASHVGRRRAENQDRFLAAGSLFAVADGLGGYRGGSKAAEIAVRSMSRLHRLSSLDQLIAGFGSANAQVLEAARDDPRLSEMSTTLCALAALDDSPPAPPRLAAGNVGDSRLYALTRNGFQQITVDHTVSQNLLRDGLITPQQAARHKDRHTLTRAVGHEPRVAVDGWVLAAVAGMRLLLCSDGLTNEVPEPAIAEMLRAAKSPAAAATRLIKAAVRPRRGRDNATAVVVDVLDGLSAPPAGGLVMDTRLAVGADRDAG